MDEEEVFVPEGGEHECHRVRVAGRGLIKTAMRGDPPQPVTLYNQTVLYCSCGDVVPVADDADIKAVMESIPRRNTTPTT